MKKMALVMAGVMALNAVAVIDLPYLPGEEEQVARRAKLTLREGESRLASIFRMSRPEEMIVSEEDVEAELKEKLAARIQEIEGREKDDVDRRQTELPASVSRGSQGLQNVRKKRL